MKPENFEALRKEFRENLPQIIAGNDPHQPCGKVPVTWDADIPEKLTFALGEDDFFWVRAKASQGECSMAQVIRNALKFYRFNEPQKTDA